MKQKKLWEILFSHAWFKSVDEDNLPMFYIHVWPLPTFNFQCKWAVLYLLQTQIIFRLNKFKEWLTILDVSLDTCKT